MQLSNHPQHDTGRVVPVPRELKNRLVPWATSHCKEYDFGHALLQELITPDYGIYITSFDVQFPAKMHATWDRPTVTLQYTREGEILCRINNQEKIMLEGSKYNLFYLTAGAYVLQPLPGISESLHIEIGPTYLKDLLTAHAPLQKMMHNLYAANTSGGILFPARMTGKVKSIIHEMYQSRKAGHSLQLEMKTLIYRLLCAYDDEITLNNYLETVQASKTSKLILGVRHHIIDYPHIHECSLDQLSKRFNISPSSLKVNFKKQCDISLGDFVQQQCIIKAQQLLLLGIDSIRDIALQLGYTDVSNFSRAFRKYMGCPPNEMKLHPERYRNGV
ncbi:helix-turn-helix transcriptional regulator [Chitinophaga agrisoli]|nr:AraC family transcriptional regulator [Chitinophaga agrisoli]